MLYSRKLIKAKVLHLLLLNMECPNKLFQTELNMKKKIYEAVDSNSSTKKRHRFKPSTYEHLDDACYKWLVNAMFYKKSLDN